MITDHIVANDIAIEEMMWLAMQGGAFELLAEEPELYSPEDSKPAKWPQNVASANLLKSELPNTDKPTVVGRNQTNYDKNNLLTYEKQKHQTK